MAVLILAMMAATVIEKVAGTPEAFSLVYHNPLFFILWGVAAVSGIVLLLRSGAGKKVAVMGIHLSFVLILSGALVTRKERYGWKRALKRVGTKGRMGRRSRWASP